MGNFEEVKKILDECVDDFYRETHPIDDIALQICQLFEPKPDGSRELEMAKMAWRDFLHAHADECDVDAVVDLIVATTASIGDAEFAKVLGDSVKAWHERLKEKDAECQERVERIFKEIEQKRGDSNLITPWGISFDITWEEWQALKKHERKK